MNKRVLFNIHAFSESLLYNFRFSVCLPLKGSLFYWIKYYRKKHKYGLPKQFGTWIFNEFSQIAHNNQICLSSEVILERNLGDTVTCTGFCKLQVKRTKLTMFPSQTMWSRTNGSFSLSWSPQISRNSEKHRNIRCQWKQCD